jgi:hypothetical protein
MEQVKGIEFVKIENGNIKIKTFLNSSTREHLSGEHALPTGS